MPLNPPEFEKTPVHFFLNAIEIHEKIPDDIKTLLDLTKIVARCYEYMEEKIWQLTDTKSLRYLRIKKDSLANDDAWREVIGLLLDYSNDTIKPPTEEKP